ncbi:MAG: nickel pincer cofactor biosynthesis protein LarC [Actinomycetota bacterium]|nr:nickel pincer cofactor biosynthesis protein LarC [Actinomycetota bacterium]
MSNGRGYTAWFHCFAGTAGDMTMASLIHAGADQASVASIVAHLPVNEYALTFEPVLRCGLAAVKAVVVVDDGAHGHRDHDHGLGMAHDHGDDDHADDHGGDGHGDDDHTHDHGDDHTHDHGPGGAHAHAVHRPYRAIREMLELAELPTRVRDRALRTFRVLAEVEGAMHGMRTDDVEFHEVGSVDAIVDIVGTCAALEVLGIDRIVCSPITVGQGTVRAAHGEIPNPAPAVMALLASRGAPSRGIADRKELATPTGVALMVALADEFGPMPAMTVHQVGYGAGSADIEGRPNVVQVVVGAEPAPDQTPQPGQPAQLLEVNVDDATGEVIAHTIAALIAAGAHDAWASPIVMKKGRPAHTVHALCDPARAAEVGAVLLRETGSLGMRGSTVRRWPQRRDEATVVVQGHPVRVKLAPGRAKVEHDDAVAAAAALGLPLREVLQQAAHLAAGPPAPRT